MLVVIFGIDGVGDDSCCQNPNVLMGCEAELVGGLKYQVGFFPFFFQNNNSNLI